MPRYLLKTAHLSWRNRPKFRATKVLKGIGFFLKDKKLLENILTNELHIKRLKTITLMINIIKTFTRLIENTLVICRGFRG